MFLFQGSPFAQSLFPSGIGSTNHFAVDVRFSALTVSLRAAAVLCDPASLLLAGGQ